MGGRGLSRLQWVGLVAAATELESLGHMRNAICEEFQGLEADSSSEIEDRAAELSWITLALNCGG